MPSMPYSLSMLWREQTRFLAAILAVTFSALLIALQCGLLLGLLAYTSLPVDRASADIWVTNRDVPSMALAHPIPERWQSRLAQCPEVVRTEILLYGLTNWHKPNSGAADVCCVLGSQLGDESIGAVHELGPELRARLTEPCSVVIDESEVEKLGLTRGLDEYAEVAGHRVHVVGLVKGISSTTAPYVFCSLETARMLLPFFDQRPDLATYVLARCRDPRDAAAVAERLSAYPDMQVFTREDFSLRTRVYWLVRTRAGTAMACTAVLALLVGLVVTSQTLYAATMASLREYAVLDALGLPRWRMAGLVLAKSFWIGLIGIVLSVPASIVLGWAARFVQAEVLLPSWLLAGTAVLTMGIALISGVTALRSLVGVEPATLLR